MFCVRCGAEAAADALFCARCGARLISVAGSEADDHAREPVQTANPDDDGGFIWSFLAFCIPLVGLFLYLKWQTDRPATAKSCLAGLLIWAVLAAVGLLLGLIALIVIAVLI